MAGRATEDAEVSHAIAVVIPWHDHVEVRGTASAPQHGLLPAFLAKDDLPFDSRITSLAFALDFIGCLSGLSSQVIAIPARVDDDLAPAQHSRRVGTVGRIHLVVVDKTAALVVPDPDAELVLPAAVDLPVNGRQDEAVIARVVDLARALVLRPRARHDQPFVNRALEVEIGHRALELSLAFRYVGAFLVLRDEAEVGFAGQG